MWVVQVAGADSSDCNLLVHVKRCCCISRYVEVRGVVVLEGGGVGIFTGVPVGGGSCSMSSLLYLMN